VDTVAVLGNVVLVVGRFGLSNVTPVVGSTVNPEFPARAVVGDPIEVGASVVLRDAAGRKVSVTRMHPGAVGTDRWHATVVADKPGAWSFAVEAWSDPMETWHHAVTAKIDAGQGTDDLANDLASGARLFDQLAKTLPRPDRPRAAAAARALRDTTLDLAHRVAPALDDYLQRLAHDHPIRELVTASPRYPLWIDRPRALYGSWYEFFPRSIGAELAGDPAAPARPARHGTFKDATEHLDYVASLGFDVVYLPPIHPIGEVNRKGPNNTLVAATWDVGSPWAIGSADGGHDAVHPDLGTLSDFTAFVKRARELNLEVALDFALQCAPDHPWVTEHPEWFTTKPDGTIAYAENPPKKYQLRPRDFAGAIADGRSLAPLVGKLNRIRREHPALQQLRNIHVHRVDNPDLTAYSKRDAATGDTILVVCTTNPHEWREATVSLDLEALGLEWDTGFGVRDLLTGDEYTWGEHNYVRLDPLGRPAHIFEVRHL
jgi:starch synthase (maltosyl-transferring)